jgi:hypothetical protein
MTTKRIQAGLTSLAVTAAGLLLAMPSYAQEAAEEPAKGGTSFLSVVFGGTAMDLIVWLMIFLTSLATLALIIDSCLCIRAVKIMPADLIETVKNSLAEGDLGAAMEACEATPGPLSNILMSGFNSITEGYDVVLDSVSSQASIETENLEDIKAKTDALMQASMKLGEAMYKSQQAQSGAQGASQGADNGSAEAPKDDNVVDADYEEVK